MRITVAAMNRACTRWCHAVAIAFGLAAIGCGSEATAPTRPEDPATTEGSAEDERDEGEHDEGERDEGEHDEADRDEPERSDAAAVESLAGPGNEAVRQAVESLLPQLEPIEVEDRPADCTMGCVYQNDERLVAVMPLGYEGTGEPSEIEVRAEGRDPLVRNVAVRGSDAAWEAYQLGEGPAPWRGALRRAMPSVEHSRPALDLATRHVVRTFGLSEYAVLVALGGSYEGRLLYVTTTRYAHHIYLVFGSRHQVRWIASLPLRAESWDGMFLTTTCVQPIGIQQVYEIPGSPQLLLQLFHPSAGHDGIDRYSTLLVRVDDGASLTADETQTQAEIEASLSASGPRVRAFSAELREGAACDTGCVYFREDHTFAWAFPDLLDGEGEPGEFTLRQLDGALAPTTFPRQSVAAEIEGALGEAGGTLARDLIARSVVASWNGIAYSPLVELGRPHMPRRLVFVPDGDDDVLFWLGVEERTEVGRLPRARGDGPWGIDRVLSPEGAGYPLIVVATAAVRPEMGAAEIRHRVALQVIERVR